MTTTWCHSETNMIQMKRIMKEAPRAPARAQRLRLRPIKARRLLKRESRRHHHRLIRPTFIFGNSSKSSCWPPICTRAASIGSTERRASSRSWTRLGWPPCGVRERTDRLWTTTSSLAHSDNIIRKGLWRKLRELRDLSISSVTRITSKSSSSSFKEWVRLR